MSASSAWVSHPCDVFVFVARVGNYEPHSASFWNSPVPSEETV